MKRFAPLAVIAVLLSGYLAKDHWFPRAQGVPVYLGYVEGETVLISAPVAGRLVRRSVNRGDTIGKDQTVFQIDPAAAGAEVARASAAVEEASAQLDNIKTGRRDVELDIIRAQRKEAEAALQYAEQDWRRATELVVNGNATRARVDQTASQVQQMRARVAQMTAQEAAADLGGRAKELEAAQAKVVEAKASLEQAKTHLSDLAPVAPADGLVENTFFDPGEWVGAGQPIVSLLPADMVKLRFFVPQDHVAQMQPGAIVGFTCDGCAPRLEARISYVSPRAEFTPPVIYSESARQKLVYLVEAIPLEKSERLRPGLPVEVEVIAGAPK